MSALRARLERALGAAAGHPRRTVVAWLAVLALLVPLASGVEQRMEVAARVPGSESEEVARRLARDFGSPFAQYAVLVIEGAPSVETLAGEAVLAELTDAVRTVPGVMRTFSWLDARDSLWLARGGTFVVVGLAPPDGRADAMVQPLRAATGARLASLHTRYPALALAWTGEVMLNHDLRIASAADAAAAERRVLPVTALLLVLAFGGLLAALLPVGIGMAAIVATSGILALAAMRWPLSVLALNVVSMLGLGLGIDYALLTVARFREARDDGATPRDAAIEAARRAGATIVVSAVAVAIGLGALLVMPVPELRSVGAGGLVVTVVAAALAMTLVPAVLAIGGRRFDRGGVVAAIARVLGRRGVPTPRPPAGARWRAWARVVTTRPLTVLVVAGLPLLLLAWQARRLRTELPRGDWLPPALESARGAHRLQAMERSGIVQAVRVVIDLPDGVSAWDARGWEATRRVGDALAAEPLVARVRALPTLVGDAPPAAGVRGLLPADVLATLASPDGNLVLVEAMPREGASPRDLNDLVRRVRARSADALTGVPGTRVLVGGLPAFNADYGDAIGHRGLAIVALVVVTTALTLALAFRSVLVPLKAVALNLLSVACAFGVVVLVFQDGHLASLVGLQRPLDGTFPAVWPLVFCVTFGLSMDYEVFLVARVAEARRSGLGEREAVAEGLARTGGVITSAAAVMLVVFAAFALGDFVLMKILGVALAVAVLVDATVVRVALGPALLVLAGRWNWWPGERGRALPTTRARGPRRATLARAPGR
jgi:RND superfamily putative drug exporter